MGVKREPLEGIRSKDEQSMAERSSRRKPQFVPPEPANDRVQIEIVGGEMPTIIDAAEKAIIEAECGLYQRSGMVVRPAVVPVTVSDGTKVRAQQLVIETPRHLADVLTRIVSWVKYDARSERLVAKDCPKSIAETYLERVGEWRLPILSGIVSTPTLRPDGSLIDRPGYDTDTGLLFDPQGVEFPSVPMDPDKDEALEAREAITEIVREFPFVGGVDKSVFLSLVLTAIVRRSLPTAPGHGITAPVAGSGKSMLVDIASIIATGRRCGVISQGKNTEETEKKLVGVLIAGDQIMSLDNCVEPLDGDLLCQMLTQQFVKPRILGRTGNPECLTNMVIVATGNNLRMRGDMSRRWLQCSLDAGVERPENRKFEFDAIEEAMRKRPQLAVAALTMMRAYLTKGTSETPPLGSYGEWSRMVRNTLIWLGNADPVLSMESVREEDPERIALEGFIEQWTRVIGNQRMSCREIIEVACQKGHSDEHGDYEDKHPEFRALLSEIANSRGSISNTRLGKWLAANAKRPIGRLQVQKDGILNGLQMWVVKERETGKVKGG